MKIDLNVKNYIMPKLNSNILKSNHIEITPRSEKDSVSLTISYEGKEKYRQKIQEINENSANNIEDVILQKQELIEEAPSPEIDYNFWLGGERNKLQQQGEYISIEEKANNLLNAYAKIYDEIVTGYENGTRESYVLDSASDTGYRKMTKEEEISGLNAAYDKYVDYLNFEIEHIPETIKIYKNIMDSMTRLERKTNGKQSETFQKLSAVYEILKEEEIPENANAKLRDAASSFINLYAKERNIQTILKSIKVF